MKISTLLTSVICKTGCAEDVSFSEINNQPPESVEIPDSIGNKIISGLMTMDEARKSPDLLKHFNDFVTRGDNEELDRSIQSAKLSEADAAEIKNQPTAGKRWKLFSDKTRSGGDQYNEIVKKLDEITATKNAPRQDYDDLLEKRINEAQGTHTLEDHSDNNYKEGINSIRESWQQKRY